MNQDLEGNAQYKGELCDEVTPIEQYIADSLHVGLRTGDFAQSIVMLQAQRVENLYRGTGIHAYHAAACCTGFKHFGEKMKAYCKGELKAKVRTLNALTAPQASNSKDAGIAMSFSAEFVHEFKAMLSKPSVTKARLQEILQLARKFSTDLVKGPKNKKSTVPSTSKTDLVKAICMELDKILDNDVVMKHIVSSEEKSKIDCALQLRLYDEVVVEGSLLELATIFEKAGCKINGRDAEKLIIQSAAKKQVQQLSIHFINKHLKVNDASRKLISQLAELSSDMACA